MLHEGGSCTKLLRRRQWLVLHGRVVVGCYGVAIQVGRGCVGLVWWVVLGLQKWAEIGPQLGLEEKGPIGLKPRPNKKPK